MNNIPSLQNATLIHAFAKELGFVRFQIESFNNFIERKIQKVFDEIGKIEPEVPEVGELVIKFGKASVGEPYVREADGTRRTWQNAQYSPVEARVRDLTYAAPVYVEMTPIVNKVEQEPVPVQVGDIPVMIKSDIDPTSKLSREELEAIGEDPQDPGGYFIINGTERALILTEEISPNRIIVEKQKVGNFTEALRINSERGGYTQRHLIERKNDSSIVISFANIRRLPIVVLLKSLGHESDKEIIDLFKGYDQRIAQEFYGNLYESEVKSHKEALNYIATHMKIAEEQYKSERVENIIDKYLLPHLGQDSKARKVKAKYLAIAIEKIISLSTGKTEEDDIDHYANKRVRMAGDMLETLFRSILVGRWGLITRIKYNYQKMAKRGKLPPVQTIVEANVVSNQINSAMATGTWTGGRTGVSQKLDRANFIKSISHMRMVLSPLTATQEHFKARELHPTFWGRFCPAETPEGPTIGLRKNLSLMAQITTGILEQEKEKFLKFLKLREEPQEGDAKVIINGTPAGFTNPEVVSEIRKRRRADILPKEINTSFYRDTNEIKIATDSGRVRRPLIVLENGSPKLTEDDIKKIAAGELTWVETVKSGAIEFLDAEEEDEMLVALYEKDITPKHTHLEILPTAILGLSASLLPFSQHNRGDRVNFGAKMIGQAVGIYSPNYFMRTEAKSNLLIYPQTPLVETAMTSASGLLEHPAGQNIVIAVATYHGYNINDAIVFNKASVERGLFRSFFYRVYGTEQRRYWGGQEDKICVPDKDVRGYRSEEDYNRLNEDGIIAPETPVLDGDVLVGKISPMRFLSSTELMGGIANMRESSVTMGFERGVVDRVFVTETLNGTKLIKAVVRDLRVPEVGDKFASRHGQKSVIGMIAKEEDLPFSASGYTPDLIFNPHGIPSRQTIGQLLEILAGKSTAFDGKKIDATAFGSLTEKEIRNLMANYGFRSDGKEVFYNGITGEKMEFEIFVGLTYYQKLDHMVANKIQARSRGPVTLLTRQPTEGKAKEGGIRFGEMEKDCLIAHGAVLTLKERFDSDKVSVPICRKCGVTAAWDKQKDQHVCPLCRDTDVAIVDMSYAFKLLLDELKALLIYPKVVVVG
ncbi:MAG TPA: DNA-directed RNA polymerase subunit B [archaeon]|nr:DNA-directed RNA polymerase subunit B [archaeon]